MSPEALSELISSIAHNLVAAGQAGALTDELIPPVDKLAVMRPKDRAHGDWASNIAMQLAKKAGMKPRDLAEPFAAALAEADGIAKVEVAGPGFINITLDSASAAAVVDTVLAAGAVTDADKHLNKVNEYGRNDHLGGQTLNLEFVSANPTGPIHIGGTRWAAVGDAMARVLEANGAKVVREYYFNDHGEQINRFAKSLVAAWAEANNLGEAGYQTETPCDGYKGTYINEIAARVRPKPSPTAWTSEPAAPRSRPRRGRRTARRGRLRSARGIPQARCADDVRRDSEVHEELPRELRRVVR